MTVFYPNLYSNEVGYQGSRSSDFWAEIQPNFPMPIVYFFLNSIQKIPNLTKTFFFFLVLIIQIHIVT